MKSSIKYIVSIVVPVLVVSSVVYATSKLTPPGSTSPTSYTLTDIYNRLTANGTTATTSAGSSHTISTTTSPADSFHTLTDIYNAIPNIDAGTILTGTTILGVHGSASSISLANMWNGSCNNLDTCPLGNEFPGGSQTNGGVDDFNWNYSATTTPLIPAPGRYATTWTTCNPVNNYCGLGDTASTTANMKDDATGLVWSWLCTGSGCATFDTVLPDPLGDQNDPSYYWNSDTNYTWDNSGTNNNSLSAAELCSQHAGWYLPGQKQLMQAYIDGSYGNLEPVGVDRYYWSATTESDRTAYAWYVDLASGYTNYYNKNYPYFTVRCVRE